MAVILGIDPGSCVTGYGLIQVERNALCYVDCGCIRVSGDLIGGRLQQIFTGLREVIDRYHPEEIAIEQVFVNKNPSSALKLGQARGVAIVASVLEGMEISEYSPRQIKKAVVGYGGADKQQIQKMICMLLKLSTVPASDAADALAVAVCHAHTRSGRKT